MLLCGYSGLLNNGTRIHSSLRYFLACNLFVALVGKSGQQKTPLMRALISDNAAEIRREPRDGFLGKKKSSTQSCRELPKRKPSDPPRLPFPHLQDYTPESLTIQLVLH